MLSLISYIDLDIAWQPPSHLHHGTELLLPAGHALKHAEAGVVDLHRCTAWA